MTMPDNLPQLSLDDVKSRYPAIRQACADLTAMGICAQAGLVEDFRRAVENLIAKLERTYRDSRNSTMETDAIVDQPGAVEYIRAGSPEFLHARIYSMFLKIYEKDFWGIADYRPALERAIAAVVPVSPGELEVMRVLAEFPCNTRILKSEILDKYLATAETPLPACKFWRIARSLTDIFDSRSGNCIYALLPARQIVYANYLK